MIQRHWRSSPYLLISLLGVLLVGWVFRSRVVRFLAPVEPDYTASADLTAAYPRPRANLEAVWTVALEAGYGGATIEEDEVFVLDREVGVADTLRVLDLRSGEQKWSFGYPAPGRLEFPGSRTRPVVAGDFVYLCGSLGQVNCIDRRTHEARWSRDLAGDCGGERPDFGWAASPLVFGELVILPALGADVGLIAFDRFSGETVWTTDGVGHSHSTPVIMELLGRQQLLFLSSEVQGRGADGVAPLTVSAFDPTSGKALWSLATLLTSVPIPPPVRVDDEHFFVTGGYGGGSALTRLRQSGDEYAFEQVFRIEKGAQLHPPVIHKGHIYLLGNENLNDSRRRREQGGLICLDLNGQELWSTGGDPYFGRGHLMRLGGYLLIQDGYSGILRMCLASPRGYQQVATANVFESPPKARLRMWAPMARTGGTFVVRGERELRCVHLSDLDPRE